MDTARYKVTLDEQLYPGKTIVVVEEPGLVMRWPFFTRLHAERKAQAEIERLQHEFPA